MQQSTQATVSGSDRKWSAEEMERVNWLGHKIEHARRNVEVCLRGYTDLAGSDAGIRKLFGEAIEANIKILHETPNMELGASDKKVV